MSENSSCRHIKTNGEQCESPHLREQPFCYFHHRLHTRHHPFRQPPSIAAETSAPVLDRNGHFLGMEPAGSAPAPIDLGPLEDRGAVQVAISVVVNALASGQLDTRRATALLYGLQLASSNCPLQALSHSFAHDPVTDIVHTRDGLHLAPESADPFDPRPESALSQAENWG